MKYSKREINNLLNAVDDLEFSEAEIFFANANNYLVEYLERPDTFDSRKGALLIEMSYEVLSFYVKQNPK